ncbi:hypothetical protein LL12F50_41860 [Escherichia coli]
MNKTKGCLIANFATVPCKLGFTLRSKKGAYSETVRGINTRALRSARDDTARTHCPDYGKHTKFSLEWKTGLVSVCRWAGMGNSPGSLLWETNLVSFSNQQW